MILHFIVLAIILVCFFFIGFIAGRVKAAKKIQKKKTIEEKDAIASIIALDRGLTMYIAWVLVMVGLLFAASYSDLRANYISKYRKNEIVEQVTYKYKKINGEKIVTDSTFCYVRNK